MTVGHEEKFARIRLLRSSNIGPVSYFQLLSRFGSGHAALAALPDLARRGGARSPRIAKEDDIRREMALVQKSGAKYIFHDDPDYSALLSHIDSAPPILTWRGNVALLNRPSVAMVGARNASAAACKFARTLAHDLAAADCTVVSGLARGVDTAAHTGAGAHSIGVIASGIDIAYPPENAALQEKMAHEALVIAEQPPGTQPLARHFPYRNRIIAGLATGTLVVEAAPRSGSLITARLAGEAGREVMAIPGSPLDPRSRGCNMLIRNGAILVQSAEDILELLGSIGDSAPTRNRTVFEPSAAYDANMPDMAEDVDDSARTTLHDLLSMTAISTDELVRQSGLSASETATILLELELAGRLERHAGGKVSLRA